MRWHFVPLQKERHWEVAGVQIMALEDIPQGHKMALKPVKAGEEVIKYGFRIGYAKEDIQAGQWIHVHNLKTALGDLLSYEYEPVGSELKESGHVTFDGFRRTSGKVGVEMKSGSFRPWVVSIPLHRHWKKQRRSL